MSDVLSIELVVSIGDPEGVGPEVSLRAARELCGLHADVRVVLVGDESVLKKAGAEASDLRAPTEELGICTLAVPLPEPLSGSPPSRAGGAAAYAALSAALRRVGGSKARALVTAPLSKQAVALTRPGFHGHTDWLAAETGSQDALMLFDSEGLRVALATVHVPLRDVPAHLTVAGLRTSLSILDRGLRELFGIAKPRIAVLALNPHGGEGGLLGDEEELVLKPAIQRFVSRGGQAEGPFSADSFFRKDRLAGFDAVLAMYHDQGLLPLKALAFGEAVNVTLGLPIVRTSVDHGCAYDLAGQGRASATSMLAAMKLARRLVLARQKT